MPRLFSIKPSLTFKGRKFKGVRGFAGKPFHPPLTDIPVGCYVITAIFDTISALRGAGDQIANDFFLAGTYALSAGAIVSVPTIVTGLWDWWKSTTPRTQAWRTANFHMLIMGLTSLIVVVDINARLVRYAQDYATWFVAGLSILAGLLVSFGALYGGALVYEYGFNVETAGDHPVWHESEEDVLPGEDPAIDS